MKLIRKFEKEILYDIRFGEYTHYHENIILLLISVNHFAAAIFFHSVSKIVHNHGNNVFKRCKISL